MTIVFSTGGLTPHGRTHPPDMISVRQPEEIRLSGRGLTSVPDNVIGNSRLRILDLSHNELGQHQMASGTVLDLTNVKGLTRLNLSANGLRSVPVDFGQLPFLEVLSLVGNELEELPESLVNLSRLQRLHCDFNHLRRLPSDLSQLCSLVTLTLSRNGLQQLPTTAWSLRALEALDLRRNALCALGPLPEGAAPRLAELNLSRNRLAGRIDLSPLTSLTHLDVSHNQLEFLELSCLQRLESLNVNHNQLHCLELHGSRLRVLKASGNELETISCKDVPLLLDILDISQNVFQNIPEWVLEAKSMRTLSADHNRITNVPKELFACNSLVELKLNHNQISLLPDLIRQYAIRSLSMQSNKLEKLPDNFFWAFPCLDQLNLSCNCLTALPQSSNTILNLRELLLSGNRISDLSNLAILLKNSRVESLHLSYNCIKELTNDFLESVQCVRTLSLSGNELQEVSTQILMAKNLEKLYLHSNNLHSIPTFTNALKLKVLDLACNKLHQLELASIVPKELTYLDLSANSNLKIDPTDFQHLCCQRSVAVVDVNCAGRQAPVLADTSSQKEADSACPWVLGFTESQEGNTRIYIEFQRESLAGRQEALVALMELEDPGEAAQLRAAFPDLLKSAKADQESGSLFLKNALIAAVKFCRVRGYPREPGVTICQLSSNGGPVSLRLGTVGRPPSCVLGRAGTAIALVDGDGNGQTEVTDMEWSIAMQAADVCCNNYLSTGPPHSGVPVGSWSSLPEPEVRELSLGPQDRFLVLGAAVLPPPAEASSIAGPAPVAAAKALADLTAALGGSGRRECVAVVALGGGGSGTCPPDEEEGEKYRCWEFMLEQNHKLLFSKELETIHKGSLNAGETESADPATCWYTSALSKYKCPLPSHRGRYYCYGSKLEG